MSSAAQDRAERRGWLPRREKHTYRVGPESRDMIDARWWTWRGRSLLLRRTVRSV